MLPHWTLSMRILIARSIGVFRTMTVARNKPPAMISTHSLISQMLLSSRNASDLILSPFQPPHLRLNGQLMSVQIPGLEILTAKHTARIAAEIIGENHLAQCKAAGRRILRPHLQHSQGGPAARERFQAAGNLRPGDAPDSHEHA